MTDESHDPTEELAARRRRLADRAARLGPKQSQADAQAAALRDALNESARLLRANRPGEAAELLRSLHGRHRTNPDLAINLGGAYILQRKWDKAVKVLAPAAEANPSHAMLWTNLAAAHLGRLELAGPKQQRRAIDAYERALAADPKAPNVHYHLGLIYKEQQAWKQARHHFEQALAVNPADKDARHWLKVLATIPTDESAKDDSAEQE